MFCMFCNMFCNTGFPEVLNIHGMHAAYVGSVQQALQPVAAKI
jgi:hypothetical protein